MNYKELKLVDLRNIAKSRGLGLWSQLKKADMISFIEENDKIDQTQHKELIEKQRVGIEQRYRDVTNRNSPKPKEEAQSIRRKHKA